MALLGGVPIVGRGAVHGGGEDVIREHVHADVRALDERLELDRTGQNAGPLYASNAALMCWLTKLS